MRNESEEVIEESSIEESSIEESSIEESSIEESSIEESSIEESSIEESSIEESSIEESSIEESSIEESSIEETHSRKVQLACTLRVFLELTAPDETLNYCALHENFDFIVVYFLFTTLFFTTIINFQ